MTREEKLQIINNAVEYYKIQQILMIQSKKLVNNLVLDKKPYLNI